MMRKHNVTAVNKTTDSSQYTSLTTRVSHTHTHAPSHTRICSLRHPATGSAQSAHHTVVACPSHWRRSRAVPGLGVSGGRRAPRVARACAYRRFPARAGPAAQGLNGPRMVGVAHSTDATAGRGRRQERARRDHNVRTRVRRTPGRGRCFDPTTSRATAQGGQFVWYSVGRVAHARRGDCPAVAFRRSRPATDQMRLHLPRAHELHGVRRHLLQMLQELVLRPWLRDRRAVSEGGFEPRHPS